MIVLTLFRQNPSIFAKNHSKTAKKAHKNCLNPLYTRSPAAQNNGGNQNPYIAHIAYVIFCKRLNCSADF
jgi:hypothetical protein